MVFSTIIFLFRFLPITLALYYLAPAKLKNTVLFLCSLVFYCWGEVRFFPVMVALILINYLSGLAIEHFDAKPALRRFFLLVALIGSLGMLFYFKYANFVLRSANALLGTAFAEIQGIGTLPLGISFYTFQTLSYSIDVYRRDVKAERNIVDFGAYVVMFPQLIAGPIVRYADIEPQLKERRSTPAMVAAGAQRFVLGLGKKVLIANVLYQLITVYKATTQPSVLYSWMYAAAYMLHIYFDFSGYSDMAIGLGKIFGFTFAENFNYPYISRSVTEFWRRWHMSLGSWFRDYVYIPLGGSREGKARTYLNLLAVWVLTGLWHGSTLNFLLWGLFLFVLIALERAGWDRVLSRVYMVLMIPLSWLLFAIPSVGRIGVYLGRLFPIVSRGVAVNAGDWLQYGKQYWWLLVLGIVFSTPGPEKLWNRIRSSWLGTVILAVLFWACVYCMSVATNDPFLYFSF